MKLFKYILSCKCCETILKPMGRILSLVLLFLFMVISVNGSLISDNQLYYSFDASNTSGTNMVDLSFNGNDGTCVDMVSDCNTVEGLLINASDFDGSNDHIEFLNVLSSSSAWSISAWVYMSSLSSNNVIVTLQKDFNIQLFYDTINSKIVLETYDGTSATTTVSTAGASNVWYHVVATYDGTTQKIYVDGSLDDSDLANSPSAISVSNRIGSHRSGITFYDGKIDEVGVWDIALTASNVSTLYNSGTGFNIYSSIPPPSTPTLEFTNITVNGETLTNESEFITNDLDFNVTVGIVADSTNNQVNQTYFLYNSSQVQIDTSQYATNNLTGSFMLNLTEEGRYNISFYAVNNETNTTAGNFTFIIDVTPPNINLTCPSEFNSLSGFNLSSCLEVNATAAFVGVGLDSCNVQWSTNESGVIINQFNTSCTNSSINFPFGKISLDGWLILVTANDTAGNIATATGTIGINQFQYFRFIDDLGNNVTDYTFGGTDFENLASLKLFNIGIGPTSLTFAKDGYLTTSFPLNLTTSSELNVTYDVFLSRIFVNVYHQISKEILNVTVLNLELIGPTTLTTNTTTGTFNLSSFLIAGNYQMFIIADGFLKVEENFVFTGSELKTINFYMLPNNSTEVGYISIRTYNDKNLYFPEIPVFALEWDSASNTYIETYNTFSDTNGLASIPVILDSRIYKFCATYPNGITCFPTTTKGVTISPLQNGDIYPILPSLDFPNVPLTIGDLQITIHNLTLTNASEDFYNYFVDYSWVNTGGFVSNVCTKLVKDFNFSTTTVIDTCSSSSTGNYVNNFIINNSFNYIFSIYTKEGEAQTEQFSQNILETQSFLSFLDNFNLIFIAKILIVVIMIGVIPFLKYPWKSVV